MSTLWRAAPRSPCTSVVRRNRCCDESGTGSSIARDRDRSLQRIGVGLVEAAADEHVLDEPAQPLEMRQPPEHRLPHRQGRRDVFEPEAGDLLDEVDLAAHVPGAPRRNVTSQAPSPASRSTSKPRRSSRAIWTGRRTRALSPPPSARDGNGRPPPGAAGRPPRRRRPSSRRSARRAAALRSASRAAPGAGRRPSPSASGSRCACDGAHHSGARSAGRSSLLEQDLGGRIRHLVASPPSPRRSRSDAQRRR